MTDEKSISEERLKELVARAAVLDDEARQRVDLSRAKVIATEVGISTAAWDAAIEELSLDEPESFELHAFADVDDGKLHWRDPLVVAVLGLLVGAMMGFISQSSAGRFDVLTGACTIAATLGMAWKSFLGSRRSRVYITAWWAAVPIGIMIGFGRVLTDPVWFAGLSWTTTMALSAAVNYLRRKLKLRESAA
jgi:hypothetical protein